MYELVSFVARGTVRKGILDVLNKLGKPVTPTTLGNEIKTHRSTISRALKNLEKKGLVKCLTPKERVYKLYTLTKKGSNVLKEIEKLK